MNNYPNNSENMLCDTGNSTAFFSNSPVQSTTSNNYQLYIQSPPVGHIPLYYDCNLNDGINKKRRTNYRNPENSAKLNAAINMLVNQIGSGSDRTSGGHKDLKSISKLFNIPYNTLRDNYLRATTGQAPKSKRNRKSQIYQQNYQHQSVAALLMPTSDMTIHERHQPLSLSRVPQTHYMQNYSFGDTLMNQQQHNHYSDSTVNLDSGPPVA